MKKQHRFEILRRGDDRFYWLFVVLKGRRRRVLARSTRDYPSAEKAMQAIDRLRSATNVFDTTDDRFPLPATFFQIVPGVVPLVVEEFPVVDPEAVVPIVHAGPRPDVPSEPTKEPATQAAEEAVATKPAAARARKPAARRRSRATRGSGVGGGEPSASR